MMVESREGKGAGQAPTKVDGNRSPHEVCAGRLTRNAKNSQATDSRVLGGHPPRFHLQSIFGRGVKRYLHPCSFYGKGKKMIPLPAYIDPEAWVGFVEMRRAMPKTKPFTDRAAKLILYELQRIKDAGHDPNAALDQSTLRGWADVWPAKAKDIVKANGKAADATRDYLEAEKARPVVAPPENIRALVRGIGRAA